jgi:DNA-binding response OmpR family regulator
MKNQSHILLAEDDADSAEALCLLLRAHAFHVEWVSSAAEAIARFERDPACHPDTILLDLMLPDMDGVSLVTRLRASGFDPRIIIHSAASKQAIDRAARELGTTTVLRKPVGWERIREALEECGAFPQVSSR